MVPSPENTPMPDKQKDAEAAARLYSLYMRPWTLDRDLANSEVPHVTDLGQIPSAQRVTGKLFKDKQIKDLLARDYKKYNKQIYMR